MANSDGRISFQYTIPDLKRAAGSGDYYDYYNSFAIQSEVSGVIYCSASYDQFGRGIKTIGDLTADGLFGNGTDLTKQLSVQSSEVLPISGNWFQPNSPIYIRWDGATVVGTVTDNVWRAAQIIGQSLSSSVGFFNTTITVPSADVGAHFLSIEDSQTSSYP